MVVRDAVRWGATHGVMRMAIRARARAGNPDAEVLRDPAVREDPYAHYERLRTEKAFAGGAFARVSVHHEVCTEVLRSDAFGQIATGRTDGLPAVLRAALRLAGPRRSVGPIDPPSMLAVDPPEHTRYRRLVSRAFTARAVARLRERTGEIAADLLDDLERQAAGGPVDLVARYASLLPVTVISEVLGVPLAMREQFLAWGDGATPSLDIGVDWHTHREVERNLAELDSWFRGHLAALRRAPGDDLLSALVVAADEAGGGERLTDQELLATAALVFGAGFETTVNLIGNGAALLFAHPDQRRLLAEDASLWPNAVDEVLRLDPPVQRTGRRARQATTVGGTSIAEGELVLLLLAGANRDPRVFTDPATFDVTRANARDHVAFSSGIHFCLGAALARMEGEVALRALFERFPGLAPAGPARRRPTIILRGFESMPVTLGAAR